VTRGALGLPEEQRLAGQLVRAGPWHDRGGQDVELRRRRKIEEVLELSHELDLAAALEDVDALRCAWTGSPSKLGRALLELGEVLDALHRPL